MTCVCVWQERERERFGIYGNSSELYYQEYLLKKKHYIIKSILSNWLEPMIDIVINGNGLELYFKSISHWLESVIDISLKSVVTM